MTRLWDATILTDTRLHLLIFFTSIRLGERYLVDIYETYYASIRCGNRVAAGDVTPLGVDTPIFGGVDTHDIPDTH